MLRDELAQAFPALFSCACACKRRRLGTKVIYKVPAKCFSVNHLTFPQRDGHMYVYIVCPSFRASHWCAWQLSHLLEALETVGLHLLVRSPPLHQEHALSLSMTFASFLVATSLQQKHDHHLEGIYQQSHPVDHRGSPVHQWGHPVHPTSTGTLAL